jgi:hypothetical protein
MHGNGGSTSFVLCIFFLGVFWKVKCFNQMWLHHHQLESYSKEKKIRSEIMALGPKVTSIKHNKLQECHKH